jgi:hypothetical protein
MPYDRGNYPDVAPFWGDRLWAFLTETPMLMQMLKASSAGLSPAEAIADELIRRFGKAVTEKRVREFTGYLVWQALERHLAIHRADSSRSRDVENLPVTFTEG